MRHFENIPTIIYSPSNLETTALMKNLFFTLELVLQDDDFIKLYVIEGYKRLDNISFELYNSTEHWWILAKINDITDIVFDLPIDEEVLQQIALERTLVKYSSIEDTGAMDYYIGQYDLLIIENDNKRQINVIKPEYMSEVLTKIVKSL